MNFLRTAKMMYRMIVPIIVLILSLGVAVYAQAPAQTPPAAPPPQEEPLPVLSVPKDYRYDAHGRRDPFVNPVPKPAASEPPAPILRPPGLKGVLFTESGIAGVVTSKEPTMNVVIISAPQGRTYFARVGDELYDAVVKEIKLDTITFLLTASRGGNQTTPREIVRKVRPTPGEKQ
jgi:hypothetical protein